jgi:hypothetical protein
MDVTSRKSQKERWFTIMNIGGSCNFSSLPLFYFSCVLLLAGYEDWLLLFMVCQRSDQVLVMECCLCDCVIEMSKCCWMEDNAFGC